MIQRIQSFFLVLVVVGVVLMFMFPIATYTLPNFSGEEAQATLQLLPEQSRYSSENPDLMYITYIGSDIVQLKGWWLLDIMAALYGLLALVSLFLYKNRVRQMRLVSVAFLVNIVYIFLVFFWAMNGASGNGGYLAALQNLHLTDGAIEVTMVTAGTIIPLVTLVLLVLAQRAIRKDELKVRAADRLR